MGSESNLLRMLPSRIVAGPGREPRTSGCGRADIECIIKK